MDIEIIERDIEKIESVVSCKIVLDENDIINEIHIVSNNLRGAKQIARDIQSVLLATHNIQVDHKKISIAQIADDSLKKSESRLKLLGVYHDTIGTRATVKVTLSNFENTYENSMSGVNTSRNIGRMLVDATLKTVEEALDYEDNFILEDIRTTPISNDKAVVVVVSCLIDEFERILCGSCLIKNNYEIAVVKATLDAVNRFITK
ncbi:hypothetical protein [Tissierella sp. Yu-01]|uniref:hypothetical protein n=1 Tax=Tissierella sp. Yu-01 TaxID=3035694 RepID=UPI00240DD800|nr:hypothetical protein [Tissierella sp. Yu-01]WFA07953.1 hypothetical protein P3962_09425 [Tissierella sp. Yu-01]